MSARDRPQVQVICCPDGPFLIRGADSVRDEQGAEHPVTRPVVAVCRCGRSSRRPWCDGTHKLQPGAARNFERTGEPQPSNADDVQRPGWSA